MGFMDKVRSWFNKDRLELADEEKGMDEGEREAAEEDVDARREDYATEAGGEFGTMPPGHADFERDSERPGGGY